MSVLIKIPMPENCAECPCLRHDSIDGVNAYQCNITFEIRKNIDRKPKWCPLVDLGKHGDLIDRDALRAEFPEPNDMTDPHQALIHITGIWAMIDCADTVIEAEE